MDQQIPLLQEPTACMDVEKVYLRALQETVHPPSAVGKQNLAGPELAKAALDAVLADIEGRKAADPKVITPVKSAHLPSSQALNDVAAGKRR